MEMTTFSARIMLDGKTRVTETPLHEDPKTRYSWNPGDRSFKLHHEGAEMPHEIPKESIGVLIVKAGMGPPDVKPLTPPKHPTLRAAWDFGFTQKKKYPGTQIEVAIEKLKRDGLKNTAMIGAPLVLRNADMIFVFVLEDRNGVPTWNPNAWSIGDSTRPEGIEHYLSENDPRRKH